MTRWQWALVAVIAVELVVGGVVLRPRTRPAPPAADLSFVDPLLADQLRAQSANCRTPDDWAALGEAYMAWGYFPEGEACYRVAAQQERDRPERAYQWAFALERIGRLEEANAEYERAAATGHPHPDECRYYVGRNWLRLERGEDARAAFEAAGRQPAARYERARLLARAGRTAEALPILDELSREYPQAIQPYLLRQRIEVLGDAPGAAASADLADRARGHLPTPFDKEWTRLETTFARLGVPAELTAIEQQLARHDLAGAEARARAVLAAEWHAGAADLLAEVELQRGRPAEAVRILQDAVEREGPSVHLLDRLGTAQEANGQTSLAVQSWARASELGVGAAVKDIHYRLSEHYQKAGNAAYAKSRSARAYFAAGHGLYWAGNPQDARGAFEEATQLEPTMVAAWFYLGEANRLLGQAERAREAYRRCLALDPGHGRAARGLGLLPSP